MRLRFCDRTGGKEKELSDAAFECAGKQFRDEQLVDLIAVTGEYENYARFADRSVSKIEKNVRQIVSRSVLSKTREVNKHAFDRREKDLTVGIHTWVSKIFFGPASGAASEFPVGGLSKTALPTRRLCTGPVFAKQNRQRPKHTKQSQHLPETGAG